MTDLVLLYLRCVVYFCCIQHPNLQVLVFLLSFWWADWYCIISSCYQQLILISIPLWFTVNSKIFRSTVCNECFSLTRITSWVFAHVMSVSKSHKLSLNYIYNIWNYQEPAPSSQSEADHFEPEPVVVNHKPKKVS